MDPNETLKLIRQAIQCGDEAGDAEAVRLFEVLDQWLSNGGFLPEDWDKKSVSEPTVLKFDLLCYNCAHTLGCAGLDVDAVECETGDPCSVCGEVTE